MYMEKIKSQNKKYNMWANTELTYCWFEIDFSSEDIHKGISLFTEHQIGELKRLIKVKQ